MTFAFNVKMPGARWTRLHVVCPHHPDEPPVFTGSTPDGVHWFQTFGAASGVEYVIPSDRFETVSPWQADVQPVESADSDETEDGHTRWVLRCPRPSCGLAVKLGRSQRDKLGRVVLGMWAGGLAEMTVTDVLALTRGAP